MNDCSLHTLFRFSSSDRSCVPLFVGLGPVAHVEMQGCSFFLARKKNMSLKSLVSKSLVGARPLMPVRARLLVCCSGLGGSYAGGGQAASMPVEVIEMGVRQTIGASMVWATFATKPQ